MVGKGTSIVLPPGQRTHGFLRLEMSCDHKICCYTHNHVCVLVLNDALCNYQRGKIAHARSYFEFSGSCAPISYTEWNCVSIQRVIQHLSDKRVEVMLC